MNATINEIKESIIDRLSDYKGTTSYGCDLAYKLFEGENANGSVYCNAFKTKEYIKANFDLFGDFLESYQSNVGETLNPFTEPEIVHVIFLLEAVSSILGQSKFIQANWDNQLELTDENIEAIIYDINTFEGDLF